MECPRSQKLLRSSLEPIPNEFAKYRREENKKAAHRFLRTASVNGYLDLLAGYFAAEKRAATASQSTTFQKAEM